MDTVRVPLSLVPYEDPSARNQKQLKTQRRQQAAAGISEPADVEEAAVKAVSDAAVEGEAGKDCVSEGGEASASAGTSAAEETAASAQTSEDTTAPPSDGPKKD